MSSSLNLENMHMEATTKVVNQLQGKRPDLRLPSGFRFHPTDDELVRFYLTGKVLNGAGFAAQAIAEVQDLNKYEPWDLPEKANIGDQKEWYFFTLRDRKYPTGMRTNRATMAGYWKATGKDKDVISSLTCCLVGMKKTLVFYKGRAPKGEKTNWIMHEYRLEGNAATLSFVKTDPKEWVVCRIFEKKSGKRKRAILQTDKDVSYSDSHQPPVCSEVHQTATENADTKIEVGWHNDQVSCITRIQLEDMQEKGVYCSSTGNAWNNNGRSSFVAPVDSAIEIGAITRNSVYTDTLVNGSLSMVGKILNMTDELTSSLCTAATFRTTPSEQAISIFDNAQLPVKSCKMEPHNSNQAMIYSQSQTTPTGSNLPNLYGQKDRRAAALSAASVSKRTRYGS